MRPKTRPMCVLLVWATLIIGCAHAIVSCGGNQYKTIIPENNIITNQEGGYVCIKLPGPGKVTVTAQAMIGVKHNAEGNVEMNLEQNPLQDNSQRGYVIPKEEPARATQRARLIPVTLSRTFDVESAGTKTFFLIDRKDAGNGVVIIRESSLQVVYYPDPLYPGASP